MDSGALVKRLEVAMTVLLTRQWLRERLLCTPLCALPRSLDSFTQRFRGLTPCL